MDGPKNIEGLIVGDKILDLLTGRVIATLKRAKSNPNKRFYMTDNLFSTTLAKDKEIWGQTRAVLDYLTGALNFDNYIFISQQEIAQELDINRSNVSLAIKKLIKKDILKKGEKKGLYCNYMLNPSFFFKHDKKKRTELKNEYYALNDQKKPKNKK